jgi:hypothetical protein
LGNTFQANGLPLEVYVDYHSFFFTHTPEAPTQLAAALHFYEVTFRFASTPQTAPGQKHHADHPATPPTVLNSKL